MVKAQNYGMFLKVFLTFLWDGKFHYYLGFFTISSTLYFIFVVTSNYNDIKIYDFFKDIKLTNQKFLKNQ